MLGTHSCSELHWLTLIHTEKIGVYNTGKESTIPAIQHQFCDMQIVKQ